jgi:hypothetical protein
MTDMRGGLEPGDSVQFCDRRTVHLVKGPSGAPNQWYTACGQATYASEWVPDAPVSCRRCLKLRKETKP